MPLVALILIAAGCGAGDNVTTEPTAASGSSTVTGAPASTTTSDPATSSTGGSEEVSVRFEPDTGDCLKDSKRGDVGVVREASCTRPHHGEVFALLEHPAGPSAEYPGDEATFVWAFEACSAAFAPYVGSPIWRTTLDIGVLGATRETWMLGDRTFVCVAYDILGHDLTAAVRDAGSVVREGYATPFTLATGSCFNDPDSSDPAFFATSGDVMKLVGCDTPHGFEVFAVLTHPAGPSEPYPGDEELITYAVTNCAQPFEDYVGAPPLESGLIFRTIQPMAGHWAVGERELRCALRNASLGSLDTSMRASGGLAHPGFIDPSQLTVGDCWAWPADERSQLVSVVLCSQLHDSEVVGLFDHPALSHEPFPGAEELWEYSAVPCIDAFEDYVGIPHADSTLDLFPLTPSFDAWLLGDRTVACMLIDPNGTQLSGSMHDASK